jgi:hypothetical protein
MSLKNKTPWMVFPWIEMLGLKGRIAEKAHGKND